MSKLENLNDDQLGNLIKLSRHIFNKKASDVDFTSFEEIVSEDVVDILDEIGRFFGINDMGIEDYTFIVAILELNMDFIKGNEIVRPTLGKYDVLEYEWTWEKRKNLFSNKINSYIRLDDSTIESFREIGMYETYEGSIFDTDVYDSEWIEGGIDRIVRTK